MNFRPYWQFYKAIFPFVAAFGLIALFSFGVLWGYGLYCSAGLLVGFFGFQYFKKEEWYTYYNLGLTKWNLFKVSFVINLLLGLPIFILFFSLFQLIFGATRIT